MSVTETNGTTSVTDASSFDGDGQIVYEAVTGGASPTTDYLVYSSVLKGEAVTKLDSSGNKAITYVPAQGLLAAMQTTDDNHQPSVQWIQRDPVGVTEVGGGALASYDPLGNYVALAPHPAPQQPPPTPAGAYGPAYGMGSAGFNNAENYSTGCTLDGAPADCSRVIHYLTDGLASRSNPLAPPGVRIIFNPMSMGVGPYGNSAPTKVWIPGGDPVTSAQDEYDGGDTVTINHGETSGGYWVTVPGSQFDHADPQNRPSERNDATNSNKSARRIRQKHKMRMRGMTPPTTEGLTDCVKNILSRYGFDKSLLDAVVIHTDGLPLLVDLAAILSGPKNAVTWGNDVYFDVGKYNPFTAEGISKIAHEVDHVSQFRSFGNGTFSPSGNDKFAEFYTASYLQNLAAGMSFEDAYTYDILELGPEALETKVLADLGAGNQPCN